MTTAQRRAKKKAEIGRPADLAYIAGDGPDHYGDLYLIWNQLQRFEVLAPDGSRVDLAVASEAQPDPQPSVEQGVVEAAIKEFERRSKAAARASGELDAVIPGVKEHREGVAVAYENAAKYLRPFATKEPTMPSSPEQTVEATILIDTPEDYAIEEKAWVPLSMAADGAQAIEKLSADFPATDYGQEFAYVVTGRSFQRPDDAARTDYGWFVFDAEGVEERDGRKGQEIEFLPWQSCEPDAPGAVEFWDLALVEKEATHA